MKKFSKVLLVSIIFSLLLSACQWNQVSQWASAGIDEEYLTTAKTDTLFNHAYDDLLAGKTDTAKIILEEILRRQSEHAKALVLMEQITASDPLAYVGGKSYPYKTKTGDSLLTLAKTYLGDETKFYILARLNQIAIPRELPVGKTLQLPAKPKKNRRPKVYSASAKVSRKASSLYKNQQYAAVVALSEKHPKLFSSRRSLKWRLAKSYIALSEQSWQANNIPAAQAYLNKASALETSATEADKIAPLQRKIEIEKQYRLGLAELKQNNRKEALKHFSKTLELDPTHAPAQQAARQLREELVKKYHLQALVAQQQQDYYKERELLKTILTIDPNHSSAYQRKSQVDKLIKQIERI